MRQTEDYDMPIERGAWTGWIPVQNCEEVLDRRPVLYKTAGPFLTSNCRTRPDLNAHFCPGGRHRVLIIESGNPGINSAPVLVEVNDANAPYGGSAALYSGPGYGDETRRGPSEKFWTVAHLGARHNIYFSSSTPENFKLSLRDAAPDEGIVVSVYYGIANRVEVYLEGKRVFPYFEPTWDNPNMTNLTTDMPTGTNIWDRIGGENVGPGYLHVVVKGPTPLTLRVSKKIKLTKYLEVGEQEFVYQKGSQGLVRNVAMLMNIPETRIKVVGLGRMGKGEIWGAHNGVANGYSPDQNKRSTTFRSFLQRGDLQRRAGDEAVEMVFDAPEPLFLDEAEALDASLAAVQDEAEKQCKSGALKCAAMPQLDGIAPGWTCDA